MTQGTGIDTEGNPEPEVLPGGKLVAWLDQGACGWWAYRAASLPGHAMMGYLRPDTGLFETTRAFLSSEELAELSASVAELNSGGIR